MISIKSQKIEMLLADEGKLQIAVKTKQRSGRVSRTPVIVDREGV